jgi:hypothetical protein
VAADAAVSHAIEGFRVDLQLHIAGARPGGRRPEPEIRNGTPSRGLAVRLDKQLFYGTLFYGTCA